MSANFLVFMLGLCLNNAHEMIVDIRGNSAFEAAHIPESINIPLHELKAKTFLMGKNLILVANGFESLDGALSDLKAKGFASVRAMDGGLYGYCLKGGRLVGQNIDAQGLARVTSAQFLATQKDTQLPWMMVDVAATQQSSDLFPLLSLEADHLDLSEKIQALAHGNQDHRILLVDAAGETAEPLIALLLQLKNARMFYLQDGLAGLSRLLEAQRLGTNYRKSEIPSTSHAVNQTKSSCDCK